MKQLFCLAVLFYLILPSDGCNQRQKVKGCIREYEAELSMMPEDSSHCARLKKVVGCFWRSKSDCKGEVINRWRGWVLMVATLERFLDICPIDDQLLQKLYSHLPVNSKPRKIYENHLKTAIISDKDKDCAKKIHLSCNKEFVHREVMTKSHMICDDGEKWLKCYRGSGCNQESVIVRYASYVGEMASTLKTDCSG
ncbi:hypothetical protein OS493_017279 [Desmophyllum pertusum]|uniref:Uncharacterized protein n=1 Tax=Desmophyllum pertusum TaxID=174260 RepID=A0A9X0A283_9CNID|nr:hypothetical protein OS493_017279 [Desmophyllum pertusum]